jgi:hypothetical protein
VGEPLTLHDQTVVRLRSGAISSDGADGMEIVVADKHDEEVGRAAYLRLYGRRAAMTLDVVEPFWHRGVPDLLLDALVAHAAREGVTTLLARVRASDVRLLALLRERVHARTTRDGTHVHLEFSTAPPASR